MATDKVPVVYWTRRASLMQKLLLSGVQLKDKEEKTTSELDEQRRERGSSVTSVVEDVFEDPVN